MREPAISHNVGVCSPHNAKIVNITELTHNTKVFEFQLQDEHLNAFFDYKPGQFVLLTVYGIGEIPISITSSPTKRGSFELGIRKVGNVTSVVHDMNIGDVVGIRGPFGNGFPVEKMIAKDLLFVCGGIGYLPLRSAFRYAIDKREYYSNIHILYGDRCPSDVLFPKENELFTQREDIDFLQTVDKDDTACWEGNIGVVTTLFPEIAEDIDPENTIAMICGPPIMYKFVIQELEKLDIADKNIYLSLERRMECGVGKCCHCGIGDKFVCLDGPVFSLAQIRGVLEAL